MKNQHGVLSDREEVIALIGGLLFTHAQILNNFQSRDNRSVTGMGGVVVSTCWDIRSVNCFCFLKTSTLQLGMVEDLKVQEKLQKKLQIIIFNLLIRF